MLGVIQRRNRLSLAAEAFAELGFGRFDGNDPIQPRVTRLPHFAHASLPDGRKNFVGSEFIADGRRHIDNCLV
jgi:hypothetical protein